MAFSPHSLINLVNLLEHRRITQICQVLRLRRDQILWNQSSFHRFWQKSLSAKIPRPTSSDHPKLVTRSNGGTTWASLSRSLDRFLNLWCRESGFKQITICWPLSRTQNISPKSTSWHPMVDLLWICMPFQDPIFHEFFLKHLISRKDCISFWHDIKL